jgi:hypothetical protein
MSFGGHHDYVLHKNVALKVVSSSTLSVHIFGVAGGGISQCQISGLESSLYRQLWCHMSAHVGTCRYMSAHVGTCRHMSAHVGSCGVTCVLLSFPMIRQPVECVVCEILVRWLE